MNTLRTPPFAPPRSRYRLKLATWTVVREPGQLSPRKLTTPEAAAALARDLVAEFDDDKEHFWAILLNAQNRYLLHYEVSMGSQSASLVHPREVLGPMVRTLDDEEMRRRVLRRAVGEGAAALILIHNHPSGDPSPSREDIALTRQLAEGARLLGFTIHDHIIVGSGSGEWVSLQARGLM